MAVAGFSPDELDATVQENVLLIKSKAQKEGRKRTGATCTAASRVADLSGGSALPIT